MDIFTNETEFPIEIDNHFVGLRVIARNLANRELPFVEIEGANTIVLNLNLLESLPFAPVKDSKKNNLRHIKIEFEYIYTRPKIEKVPNHPFKRTSHADINGQIQPEVYITLPLGWRMDGNSIIKQTLGFGKNKEGYHVGMICRVKSDLKNENIIKLAPYNQNESVQKEIIFKTPFINLVHGKRKYSYTIKEECYKELNQFLKNVKNENISYSLYYTSQIDLKVFFISIFPFFFLLTSAALITLKFSIINSTVVNSSSLVASYSMPFIIILMSFSFFYYSLIKDGYNIPFKRYYILIFSISIIVFLICAFYSLSSTELTNSLSYTLNNTTP
ncbi:MAG: hypothetical protein FIB08_00345 [Candidatus Methanoperedens sp.]|nr:hypothetical protein [Candidatus Methanoperedens sp.]